MNFQVTHNSSSGTTLTDESGRELYKIDSSKAFLTNRTTTVNRQAPVSVSRASNRHRTTRSESGGAYGQFEELARYEWHLFSPSKLKFGGQEVLVKDYFRKQRFSHLGACHLFTAPDEKVYRWSMNGAGMRLDLKHGGPKTTEVARFNLNPSPAGASRHPILEILPTGEHIVDAIVVSFAYVAKTRGENRPRARSNTI